MSGMLVSIIAAIVLGVFFMLVWRWCVDRISPPQFWTSLYGVTGDLLRVSAADELLMLYRRLFAVVMRYTAGNVIGLVLGLLPVVLLFYFVVPVFDAYRDSELDVIEVYPANVATLGQDDTVLQSRPGARQLYDIGNTRNAVLTVASTRVIIDDLRRKTGVCWSYWYCALFESLGFKVIEMSGAPAIDVSFMAIRTDRSKYSLFWPLLNDAETLFMLVFLLTNIVVYMLIRRSDA